MRRDHGAQNLAVLRRISLNLFKQDKAKGSIKVKRKRAAWSTGYIEQLLGRACPHEPVVLTEQPSVSSPLLPRNWWGG